MTDEPEKPPFALRVYYPAKEPDFTRRIYLRADGRVNEDSWREMLAHATMDEKRSIRHKLAGSTRRCLEAFEHAWHDEPGKSALRDTDMDRVIKEHAYLPATPKKSTQFHSQLRTLIELLKQEEKGKPVNWGCGAARTQPAEPTAWELMCSFGVAMKSLKRAENPVIDAAIAPSVAGMELIDELCDHLSRLPPSPRPPSGGGGRKSSRSA